MRRQNVKIAISIVVVNVLAIALRLHHLDHESLFMDEIRQVSYYEHGFKQIILDAASQGQPPLDYWIGHIVHIIGKSDYAVRIPSVFWGCGSIALLMFLVSRYCTWPVAIGTGAVMALLPFHLYFSQEVRPYSIMMFLLLMLLWALDEIIESTTFRIWHFCFLLLSCTSFLYSSALSPLAVTVALIVWLLILLGQVIRKDGILIGERQTRLILSICVLILSCLIYLPVFGIILENGGRYAPEAARLDLSVLANGVRNFSLSPLWQAYITQLEPLGLFAFPLVVTAIFMAFALPNERKTFLVKTSAFLLPAAGILHIFVFGAKTGFPFRPPYPTYILPLVLFLTAFAVQETSTKVRESRASKLLMPIGLLLLGISLLYTTHSTWAFKSMQKKTDWRGLGEYLESSTKPNQVLILHGLVPLGGWDPTSYGFPRYVKRNHLCLPTLEIPGSADSMAISNAEPIFVLFYYHEYFLTPHSYYPIIPIPSDVSPKSDFTRIERDDALDIRQFIGLKVVKLKNPSGNFARDSFEIIRRLVEALPADSSMAGMHLGAADLVRALGLPGCEYHLDRALALSPDEVRKKLMPFATKIRNSQ
jgi:hypothetical protein